MSRNSCCATEGWNSLSQEVGEVKRVYAN
jgi:hypothetical protein